MCGIAPATAQFPAPSPTSNATGGSSARPRPTGKARKLLRLQTLQSWGKIGAVNSPRSAAKRPISSSSSLAPEGQRQRILTSTARERLLASGHRNPMSSSSEIITKGAVDKGGGCPTVLSRLREAGNESGVVLVWAVSKFQHDRRLRHALKKK